MSTALFRLEHIVADDSGPIQTVNAYGHASERLERMLRIQSHGFASNPPVGSHGLGLRLRGESDLAIALGLEHQDTRPKNIPVGAGVLYDAGGNVIRAYMDDGIQVEAKKGTVTVKPAQGKNVYLGGDGKSGTYSPIMTQDGPSSNVYTLIG